VEFLLVNRFQDVAGHHVVAAQEESFIITIRFPTGEISPIAIFVFYFVTVVSPK
jgi:hypothetical protein